MAGIGDSFDRYFNNEDEELTPSQEAAQEIKQESIGESFDLYLENPNRKPEPIQVELPKPVEQPQAQPFQITATQPQAQPSISQPSATIPTSNQEIDWYQSADYLLQSTEEIPDNAVLSAANVIPAIFDNLYKWKEGLWGLVGVTFPSEEELRTKSIQRLEEEVKQKEEQIAQGQNVEENQEKLERAKSVLQDQRQAQEITESQDRFLAETREKAAQNILEIRQVNQQELEAKYGRPEEWSNQWIANNIAANSISTIGSLIAGTTTALVTKNPYLAITVGFSSSLAGESSSAYVAAREAGVNDLDAQRISLNTGLASALIEQIPLGNFLNKIPAGKEIKQRVVNRVFNYLKNVAIDGTLEGVTESLQQVVQNAFAREYDANRDLFEGVPESFVFGAILGTGFSGVTSLFIKEDGTIDEQSANTPLTDDPDAPATANKATLDAVNTPNEARTETQKQLVANILDDAEIQQEVKAVQGQQQVQQAQAKEARITPAKELTEEVRTSATTSEFITEAPAKPEKLYRGVKEGTTGTGKANQGKGIYTTTSRATAEEYGTVTEVSSKNIPFNPLTFKKKADFARWELQLGTAMGYDSLVDFRSDYPDIGVLIAKLGYDGVAINTSKGVEYVKYPKSTILTAKQKPAKAKPSKKAKEQVQEKPKVSQETEIKSIKEGLIEGITEESAREFYNEMNITEVPFEQILAEVKEEQQKQQEEFEFDIKIQTAEQNRILADKDLNQYQPLILRGLKTYNLSKRKGKDDIATITNKVAGFDEALEAMRIAGYQINTMSDVQKAYDEYLEAKKIIATNEKRIKKLTNQQNKVRENNLREALKQANRDRGITVYRISQPQSMAQLETLANEYNNWVDFYRDLTPDNRARIIEDNNITSYYDWSKWFEKITGVTYFEVTRVQKDAEAEQRAVELYGITFNPKRAGFITSDAQMIDTGGYPEAEQRTIDHREVAQDSVDTPEGASGNEALIKYMNVTGNIRISVYDDYNINVDMVYTPNEKQMKLLESLSKNKTIYADVTQFDGRTKADGEFDTFRDFSRWVYTNTNGDIDTVLAEDQRFVKDIYDDAVENVPFDSGVVTAYYGELNNLAKETNRDAKLNEILTEFDRLIVNINNPKITNVQLHRQAQSIQDKYLMWKNNYFRNNPVINEYKFRTDEGDEALQADQETQRLTTAFLQMPEIKNAKPTDALSKGQIKNILKKAQGKGMTSTEFQITNDVLNTTFANVDKVPVSQLREEIKKNLLGIEIYETDDYADYGGSNVFGYTEVDYDYKTHVLNTLYNHNDTGHFRFFWNRVKDQKPKYGDLVANRYKSVGEFAHYRTALLRDYNADQTLKINHVLEIQSDPFQRGVGVYKPYVQLRKKVADLRDLLMSNEAALQKYLDISNDETVDQPTRRLNSDYAQSTYKRVQDYREEYAVKKEELKNFKVENFETKEEELYQTYRDNWHERVIKEIFYKSFTQKNYDVVRFPTAKTIAFVEKYNGLSVNNNEDGSPYEVLRANDPNYLVAGDTIDYDGNEYTVMGSNEDEIEVSPSEEVEIFSEREKLTELGQQQFYEEISTPLNKSFLQLNFPIITIKDLKDKFLFNELYQKQRNFIYKNQEIRRATDSSLVEIFNGDAQRTKYDLEILDYLAKNLTIENIENKGIRESFYNLTGNWDFIVETLIKDKFEKDGIDTSRYPYGQYFYGRTAFIFNSDLTAITYRLIDAGFAPTDLSGLLPALRDELENISKPRIQKKYRESLLSAQEAQQVLDEKIKEIEKREPVSKQELNQLPEPLKDRLNDFITTGNDTFSYEAMFTITNQTFINNFIKDKPDNTEIGTSTVGGDQIVYDTLMEAYVDDVIYKGRDWEYEYDVVFYRQQENGDRTIYGSNNTETFSQPTEPIAYSADLGDLTLENGEKAFSPEELERFNDEARGVMSFYATKIKSYLMKTRPDLTLYTDEETGLQWYETKQLPQDQEEEYIAFRKVQQELGNNELKDSEELTKKLIKESQKFFGDTNVKVVGQIMKNSKILGGYRKNFIDIVDGQVNPLDTFYHEAVHRYIGTVLTLQEQTKLYTAASKEFNTTDVKALEEIIAEKFIGYYNNKKSITGQIKVFFDLVADRIKSYFKHQDEIEALYKELAVPAPVRKVVKAVLPKAEQPISLPVGTGEILQSTLGVKVERRAIEASIVTEIEELPEYQQMNVKDQGALATSFLEQDTESAIAVALGTQQPPAGIIPESVFIAVENYAVATGDAELIKALATSPRISEATALGQRIRMLAERNAESPVAIITDITEARKTAIEKAKGVSVEKETQKLQNAIKKEVSKIKKGDWDSFIDSIQC